jgi:hypothetical protein
MDVILFLGHSITHKQVRQPHIYSPIPSNRAMENSITFLNTTV